MGKIVVLEPRWNPPAGNVSIAVRPASLVGKRIGLLWNAKPNGEAVLRGAAEALVARGFTVVGGPFTKRSAVHDAGPELTAEIARSADVVINAIAD